MENINWKKIISFLKSFILWLDKIITSIQKFLGSNKFLIIISIFIAFFIPLIISIRQSQTEFNGMSQSISALNVYNYEVWNTAKNELNNDEIFGKIINDVNFFEIISQNFLTEGYHQNWKIIASMSSDCKDNYLKLIGEMEGANLAQNSVISIYNLSDLNDLTNFSVKKNFWYLQWKNSLLRIDDYFSAVVSCKPTFLSTLF